MNNLPRAFEELDREIEKIILKSEREVCKNYKGILETLRTIIRKLYDKYEKDGKLSFGTMGQYDRLLKLEDEVEKNLSLLYKENSNITKATLNQIFVTTMSHTVDSLEKAVTAKPKSLIPIKKTLNIDQTVNERMNGLHWAERMGKHRGDVIWNINKTLKEGLVKGSTYREMSNRLKTELEGNVLQPMRIVRTEAGRVYAKTQEETLNRVADEGIKMTKTWRTSKDERVRSKHQAMEGVTVPYEENFVLPDGKTTKMPRLSGYAEHDIHCRCFVTIDVAEKNIKEYTVIAGAITDTYSKEAVAHAELYYDEIRAQTTDVQHIAKNTGISREKIREVKEYLFIQEHHIEGTTKRFDPDFAIAQSWQRLAQNDIKPHDLTLINHEIMERKLVLKGKTQDQAHKITSARYNYQKEQEEYYALLEKRQKRKK